MTHINKFGFALFLLLPVLLFGQFTLTLIEKKIEHDHPIPNISADSLLQQLQSSGADFLLLDTRKPDEFNQSHLQNAVRVDPDISEKKFWAQFGDCNQNVFTARLANAARLSRKNCCTANSRTAFHKFTTCAAGFSAGSTAVSP
ncbi:MAG: rhodanese-like domain-containing protein [Calditrichia bacterium]